MNERIKELMTQSGMISESSIPGMVVTTNMSLKTAEKFAELIVAECVNMIEEEAKTADEDSVHGMRNAAGLISRAFITLQS